MKKLCAVVVLFVVTISCNLAYAATLRMIGTVTNIKMLGNTAEVIVKDRKTDAPVLLQVTDQMEMQKYKDRKIRVGDELRIIYDSDTKIIKRAPRRPLAASPLHHTRQTRARSGRTLRFFLHHPPTARQQPPYTFLLDYFHDVVLKSPAFQFTRPCVKPAVSLVTCRD